MLKILSLFLLVSALTPCSESYSSSEHHDYDHQDSTDSIVLKNGIVPTEAITFHTDISMLNFSRVEEDKIFRAAELIKKVVSSAAFKKRVLNYTYNGKKQFVDNDGLTNAQIYKKILAGAERLKPLKNNTMDLELELYTDMDSNTVGYTFPSTTRVWMNSKFFNKFTAAGVTSNMMHEWLHKLGFKHDVENTPRRAHSVPYAIGYIVRQMAKNIK